MGTPTFFIGVITMHSSSCSQILLFQFTVTILLLGIKGNLQPEHNKPLQDTNDHFISSLPDRYYQTKSILMKTLMFPKFYGHFPISTIREIIAIILFSYYFKLATMVKLLDTLLLGINAQASRYESEWPHSLTRTQ